MKKVFVFEANLSDASCVCLCTWNVYKSILSEGVQKVCQTTTNMTILLKLNGFTKYNMSEQFSVCVFFKKKPIDKFTMIDFYNFICKYFINTHNSNLKLYL